MQETVKAEQLVDRLRELYERQIRSALRDRPTHEALQLADALLQIQIEELAGLLVRYRPKPLVDGEAITEAWRRGAALQDIMAAHGVSRATAYRFHPSRERQARALDKKVSRTPLT